MTWILSATGTTHQSRRSQSSKLARRYTLGPAKRTAKRRVVLVTALERDTDNHEIGLRQESLRPRDAALALPVDESGAGLLTERFGERGRIPADEVHDLAQVQRLVVLECIRDNVLHPVSQGKALKTTVVQRRGFLRVWITKLCLASAHARCSFRFGCFR